MAEMLYPPNRKLYDALEKIGIISMASDGAPVWSKPFRDDNRRFALQDLLYNRPVHPIDLKILTEFTWDDPIFDENGYPLPE